MKINERIYLALKLTMIFKHKKEKEKKIMRWWKMTGKIVSMSPLPASIPSFEIGENSNPNLNSVN
jgi:hypothetical protein